MAIKLYDLAGSDPRRRFSPACWRTRLALAHKRLDVEAIPWRFTEKNLIAPSKQGRVPVIVDGNRWVADSWTIASYLELAYADSPSLFGGDAARSVACLHNAFADSLTSLIFPLIALDVLGVLHERDTHYFRTSREERVGMQLEMLVASRSDRLLHFRESLAPLRLVLKSQPFFAGRQPLYADFALFGPFQWARCTSPFALLEREDPIRSWFDRMLDLFDGLGRDVPAFDQE